MQLARSGGFETVGLGAPVTFGLGGFAHESYGRSRRLCRPRTLPGSRRIVAGEGGYRLHCPVERFVPILAFHLLTQISRVMASLESTQISPKVRMYFTSLRLVFAFTFAFLEAING